MPRILLLSALFCFASIVVCAQKPITIRKDSTGKATARVDTLSSTSTYVNVGKIAARKAAIRSAIVPGLGQIGNGITVYRLVKVAAIYTGATLLTLSFIDNNRNYHATLEDLQYRQSHHDEPEPGSFYEGYPTSSVTQAKDTFRRNKEVVIFSFIALYGANVIEAYVDARLKYFDIGDELGLKIAPGTIASGSMYGYNSFVPAVKVSLRW